VRPGGWAFQYANAHYPDLDDTAVVVMAMDRARRIGAGARYDHAIERGVEWIKGMQSRNGGWAAFDVDNVYDYLNNIPFADHGALIDPPTEDVTARCVSMLAQLGETLDNSECLSRGVAYLRTTQRPDGSWYGRWGLNYIYGTWSSLCALNACGIDRGSAEIREAVEWLLSIQNPDGGWAPAPGLDVVALNDALALLATLDPRPSQVVELRFFGGFSVEETAETLGVSVRTVINDWNAARAWLHHELTKRGHP
jgi:squalene-hopene/tetraprenyl-beta-curcumene cyclase